ncbi:MAG: hypothetical protein WC701_01555 [Kiritimatiellales bacterium]
MTGTYHIWTIGCQMNEADSRYLALQLETPAISGCLVVGNALQIKHAKFT